MHDHPRHTRHPRDASARPATARPAFTLTEILVVIALIVLLLGISLPAFNVLTGTNSAEGARNQLSAYVARARNEAVGAQSPRGVMFYLDPATRRVTAALVQADGETNVATTANPAPNGENVLLLNLVPDRDPLALASGVMLNVIDDAAVSGTGQRLDDAYIGFNPDGTGHNALAVSGYVGAATLPEVPYGGVILFDGNGRLISRHYALRVRTASGATGEDTPMGRLLFPNTGVPNTNMVLLAAIPNVGPTPPKSSIGLTLFERSAYDGQFGGDNASRDPQVSSTAPAYGATASAERAEETWIDNNAILLLVNRYNGTLVSGD